MKIKSIKRVKLEKPIKVYDVVNSLPHHNFLIKTNTNYIISHNCALMDEVSFAPGQSVSYETAKIMRVYESVKGRMESRFLVNGRAYGLLFLVSSKATKSSFLESYIADQVKKGYPIYVVDQPLWVVKPGAYSGKTFKVAVGNTYLKSRVLPDKTNDQTKESYESALDTLIVQGYRILDVPIEHRQRFDQDLDRALQDIAGISTSAVTKPFNYQRIVECIKPIHNPFYSDIITVGMDDDLQYKDFFDVTLIPKEVKGVPVFIHLDASVSNDKTGLAAVAIIGSKRVQKITDDIDVIEMTDELVYQTVFTVAIQAPSDSQISFEKTRQFIYYLRDEVGLNIKHISTDNFQSYDTRQILAAKGFDVGYTSLDKTPFGYDGLKLAINEKRLFLLEGCQNVINELTEIEKDNVTLKWDHPVGGCLPANQNIVTNHGIKSIVNLKEGDKVLSFDFIKNRFKYADFTNLRITRQTDTLYKIYTSNNRYFECTGNHPVLLDKLIYLPAETLKVGDKLKSITKDPLAITEIEIIKLDHLIDVYDIEVPEYSNFMLGNRVIVHNSKDTSDALAGAYYDASNYKDEYLFYHPDEFDYEGVNADDSLDMAQEQFKNDFIKNEINNAIETVKLKRPEDKKNGMTSLRDVNKSASEDEIDNYLNGLLDDNILFL